MQASNNTQGSTSSSHWFDIVESTAVVVAISGSIAAAALQQVSVASIATVPLSVTTTLNLVNRRRQLGAVQENQRLEIAHLLQRSQDDIQAEVGQIKQASEGVQSQIDHLTKQDAQALQTIATMSTQADQFDSKLAALQTAQGQGESTLADLNDVSQTAQAQLSALSTQVMEMQDAIAQLQSSASDLGSKVEEQQSSSQYLAAQTQGVEELVEILREIDAYTQTISANPNDAKNFHQRGITRKRLQRLEDQRTAVEDFSQAIRMDPTFADAYFERGLLKSEFGHKQHAVDDLRTAAKFYFEQGNLVKYEQARSLSQEIHDLIAGSPSPEEETEQYLIENLFG